MRLTFSVGAEKKKIEKESSRMKVCVRRETEERKDCWTHLSLFPCSLWNRPRWKSCSLRCHYPPWKRGQHRSASFPPSALQLLIPVDAQMALLHWSFAKWGYIDVLSLKQCATCFTQKETKSWVETHKQTGSDSSDKNILTMLNWTCACTHTDPFHCIHSLFLVLIIMEDVIYKPRFAS